MSRKYTNEYKKLGEERVQEFPLLERGKGTGQGNSQESDFECYWMVRKDEFWVVVPGRHNQPVWMLQIEQENSSLS